MDARRTRARAETRRKTLLYATDLPMVESTWAYVLSLAESLDARVDVLHVVELSAFHVSAGLAPCARAQLVADAERQIRDWVASSGASDRTSGITIVAGDTIDSIVAAADAVRADMIVIGMPTNTGLGRLLRGAVTPGLLRCARRPVLVVPSLVVPSLVVPSQTS